MCIRDSVRAKSPFAKFRANSVEPFVVGDVYKRQILPSTNRARRRLNFGGMGGFSVCKLVKPIKTVCSWTPNQNGVDHLLLSKTKSYVGTAAARVLREADAAMGQELRGLDSLDRVPY